MRRLLKSEDGQVIVLVAILMTAFIGFLALVIDVGSIYLVKNRLQKTADAAVLAGAQEMPNDFEKARIELNKTIEYNRENPNNFKAITNESNTMLEVIGKKKATLYFAKVLGIEEPEIQVKARAELHPLSVGKGTIPLGIQPSTDLKFGSTQMLKVSDSANGNFGAIALTGPGADDYKTDLKNGYQVDLKIGTILDTQTGQLAGPTNEAVSERISKCPDASFDDYPPGCSRVVLVPIYEPVSTDKNQIKQVRVIGFGTFFLKGVSSTSEGAVVTGYFIRATHKGESSPGLADFGTYSFKLTQ